MTDLPAHQIDDLSRRLEASEHLLEVAAAVGREVSLPQILDALFESFTPLVPFDRMEFASVSQDGWVLTTRWVRTNYTPVLLTEGFSHRRTTSPGPADGFATHAVPSIEIDTAEYAATRPEGHPSHLLLAEGIRSGLCCPLVSKERRVGYLFFCSRTPQAYDDFHLWVMSRIAGVAAGAISTARLRDEVAERNAELEELTRFRTSYLAVISHELRTPLTGVVGLAEAMRDGFEDLTPGELQEMIGLVADQGRDAAGIVDDLLMLARTEAGQLEVKPEPLDLAALARSVVESTTPGVAVVGEAAGWGDQGRVRQIVRNLLTNAVKYGGRRVWVELDERDNRSVLMVCDDGEPIGDPEAMFQPFQRAAREDVSGSGIGLWVSRELAARMGGALTYRFERGASRFELTLPASVTGGS